MSYLLLNSEDEATRNLTIGAVEAKDGMDLVGQVLVNGDLAETEAQDIADLVGAVIVKADLDATEALDIADFVGQVVTPLNADLDATEAKDTSNLDGTVRVTLTVGATEAKDVSVLNGSVIVNADLASTEAKDGMRLRVGGLGGMAWYPQRRRKIKRPPTLPAVVLDFRLQESKDRARFRFAVKTMSVARLSEYGDKAIGVATRGGYPEDDEILMMLLAA